VKFIFPVLRLPALSCTTTCITYAPSVLALIVGSSTTADALKLAVPGPETFDRAYDAIPARVSVAVMFVAVAVLVVISDHILKVGAVISILYDCCPVLTLPALSITQAYPVRYPSVLNVGGVVDHPSHVPVNAVLVL